MNMLGFEIDMDKNKNKSLKTNYLSKSKDKMELHPNFINSELYACSYA